MDARNGSHARNGPHGSTSAAARTEAGKKLLGNGLAARRPFGKRLLVLGTLASVALLFLVAAYAVRILRREIAPGIGMGRDIALLRPETVRFLERLETPVSLTYFVSAPRSMPHPLKGVGPQVESLLGALKRRAPAMLDYRVIDPESDPLGAAYASQKGASPVKVRKVLRDESAEQPVWSSLVIAQGRHRDALIQGITAFDLPYLEHLILRNLEAAGEGIRPVIAVAAPEDGFAALPGLIAGHTGARVLTVDLDRGDPFPHEADLLFWIDPRSADAAGERRIEELRRFLASGRSAVLAGSAYAVDRTLVEDRVRYRVRRSACDWDGLLRPFGLRMVPLLLTDARRSPMPWRAEDGVVRAAEAAFQIRVLPSQLNTRSLLGPPAGALVISAASPLEPDPGVLAAREVTAEVVATTSESAAVLELPAGEFDDALLQSAHPVPKQPWLVLLKPADPWKGQLLVAGSATLFHDDLYDQPGNANAVFLRTLLRTFTDGQLLARIRVPRTGPDPLPHLSAPERLAWRAAAVFLVPAILLVLVLVSVPSPFRARRTRAGGTPTVALAVALLTMLLAILLLILPAFLGTANLPALRLDVTEDASNTPSDLTRRLLAEHGEGLTAELLMSDGVQMPVFMKSVEPRVRRTLRELGIPLTIVRPEDLPSEARDALRAEGLAPFQVERVLDDAEVTARVWSSLRIRRDGRVEAIPRIDDRTAPHIEFLLAAAVERLRTGKAPHVGVLSDLPRLSPAEAHSDYQQKGYTAPIGSDVYSFAKDLLARHGYRVSYINPEAPVFPPDMDLLVWLQPRYPQRSIAGFSAYLASGGDALVALQHYNVQQRQYRGAGFLTVYWPQPQFHNLNSYLELFGLRQLGEKRGEEAGEILHDRNHGALVLDTQVNRRAFSEYDPQQVSRPFLIRVTTDGLSRASVVTSRLGELLFIWGNRFAIDAEEMARSGFRHSVLAATSPRAWTYAWSGGWLPEESFEEPEDPARLLDGPQPLAVLIEGRFPAVAMRRDEGGRDTVTVVDPPIDPPAEGGAADGRLLLIGCSEMFKNPHLYSPRYQHDQLLLNAVAFLAHGPELAEIQARRRVPKSVPFQPPRVKLALRILAIGVAPAIFVLFGLVRSSRRRPVLRERGATGASGRTSDPPATHHHR